MIYLFNNTKYLLFRLTSAILIFPTHNKIVSTHINCLLNFRYLYLVFLRVIELKKIKSEGLKLLKQ